GCRKRQSTVNDNTSRFVGTPASSLLQDEPPSLVIQTRPCAARPLVWMKTRSGWAGSITIFTVTLAGPSGNPWSRPSQLLPPSKVAKKRPSSVAAQILSRSDGALASAVITAGPPPAPPIGESTPPMFVQLA